MRKKNLILTLVTVGLLIGTTGCGTQTNNSSSPDTASGTSVSDVVDDGDISEGDDIVSSDEYITCDSVLIADGRVTIYAAPDRSSDILNSYDMGTEISPSRFNQVAGWYMVETEDGQTGYIHSDDVSVKNSDDSKEDAESEELPKTSSQPSSATAENGGRADVHWDTTEAPSSQEDVQPDVPNYEFFDPENQ